MSTPSPLRRRALIAGVATAAAAGGAWLATRREAATPVTTVTAAGATAKSDPASAAAALWQMSFDAPSGPPVQMASLRGRPLLINFWATWCAPCVREMPEIDRFFRDHASKGWQVLGLAIDAPTPVREFLARVPVGFQIGLAGLEGTDLVRQLGNERGGLPFSLAFDAAGKVIERKLGETSYEELAGWARKLA